MKNTSLPRGWATTEIGDVAQIVSGGTPPSRDPECFELPGKGIAWLTPADLTGYKKQSISYGARDLSSKGYRSCSAKAMPAGSVLFSSRAPIGYVVIAEKNITTNQGFKSFILPEQINSRFAYYQLRHIKPEAEARATGTTFKELSGSAAAKLPFQIAPLKEQFRIADKLDTVLARVDAAQTRLARIAPLLKRFRQSVLAAATSGRLTEDWRDSQHNLEHSDSLAQSIQYAKSAWCSSNRDHNEASRVLKRASSFKGVADVVTELPVEWRVLKLEDAVLMVVDCHNKTAP